MRVWIQSESYIFSEALAHLVIHLGFTAQLEQTPRSEVALWHLSQLTPPYPTPSALPTLVLTSGQADASTLLQRGYRGHLDPLAPSQTLKRALEAVQHGEI